MQRDGNPPTPQSKEWRRSMSKRVPPFARILPHEDARPIPAAIWKRIHDLFDCSIQVKVVAKPEDCPMPINGMMDVEGSGPNATIVVTGQTLGGIATMSIRMRTSFAARNPYILALNPHDSVKGTDPEQFNKRVNSLLDDLALIGWSWRYFTQK